MFSLRMHLLISAALLALLIAVPIVGSMFAPGGAETLGAAKPFVQGFYVALFVAFGLSVVPVIVKTVLGAQVRLGNQDKAVVAAAIRRQNVIIWIMLGLMLAGAAIAIPAMILDGGLN